MNFYSSNVNVICFSSCMPYSAIHMQHWSPVSCLTFCPWIRGGMTKSSEPTSQRWSCATLGDGLDQVAMQSLDAEEAALLQQLEDRSYHFKSAAHMAMPILHIIYSLRSCYVYKGTLTLIYKNNPILYKDFSLCHFIAGSSGILASPGPEQ